MMKRWTCPVEDCDAPHCKKCGYHYDPACGQNGVCDACLIQQASDECEAVTEAFGGNYEEAAAYMGW